MASQSGVFNVQQFTDAGLPAASYRLYTLAQGTTTHKAAYTDAAGVTPHTYVSDGGGGLYIALNARGELPAPLFLGSGAYDLTLKTPAGATVWTRYARGQDEASDTADAALRADLASTNNAAKGPGMVGFSYANAYPDSTAGSAIRSRSIDVTQAPYLADKTGVADSTAAFQAAITAGNIDVPPGAYALTGDITIPSNRKIWVQKGATVTNTGGRFTAYNQENVEWQIDGWVKSVAMATAPDQPGWWPGERGFIEFGFGWEFGDPNGSKSGFWVRGTGKVSGDWVGTPNVSALAHQINRKGIACWSSANVLIEGLEVFGFDGEAVYAWFFNESCRNIVFHNLHVHDSRFNALNFNAALNGGGCVISKCLASTCYQVELSTGECSHNYIIDMVGCGIFTGVGTGDTLIVRDNVIKNAGLHSIAAAYSASSPVSQVFIENNISVNPHQYGIYVDYVRILSIKGNTLIGSAAGAGAYDIGVNNTLRGVVARNTFITPGAFSSGRIAFDANTYDVVLDPISNVYVQTTGTATPAGNLIEVVASAATLTLPNIGDTFSISGVTTITSISVKDCAGRTVKLIFQNALTVTDGSNLILSGNFVTTGNDTITLYCDGTSWYEMGRSVN